MASILWSTVSGSHKLELGWLSLVGRLLNNDEEENKDIQIYSEK